MVFSMLQNLSLMYYSQYSIIKFVGIELIYYAINLYIVSFSMVFIEFVFLWSLAGIIVIIVIIVLSNL